jgi:hypothetical protein
VDNSKTNKQLLWPLLSLPLGYPHGGLIWLGAVHKLFGSIHQGITKNVAFAS